jgi:hypothetical protein
LDARPILQGKGLFLARPLFALVRKHRIQSCGPGTFAVPRLDTKRRIPLKNVLRARVSSFRLLCLLSGCCCPAVATAASKRQIEVSHTSCPG